jgi:hypothetical protein
MGTNATDVDAGLRNEPGRSPDAHGLSRRSVLLSGTTLAAASALASAAPIRSAQAQAAGAGAKPNILMIMADDIGWFNVSLYNHGIMGYRTPNIDRIGREGAMFTDWYGEQSCTAGRAAFITGQSPIRTGLTKVGLPGATIGLHAEDMSVAEALKPLGYATGQFGKNHLGDRNEFLPTVHGFDEFFGNLYHLNAEEEPENPDYPRDPRFRARFGPRGVLRCRATDVDDPTVDPAYGKVGKQAIENTGPLDTKRMETVDEEFLNAALDFIDRQHQANTPWLCYFNPTRMHVWTHLKPASHGPVRQEPCRRSQRDAADGERLRRVLRQPLPSECRGGARAAGLSERPGLSRQIRSARRVAVHGDRCGRSHGGPALRQDRQADDRGYWRAHQEADGDDRRRDLGRGDRLHAAAAVGGQAVLLLVQLDAHAPANARPRAIAAATSTATASMSTA